ncbi:MAG: TadE/TadG family type IV pilus assembly protein [Actinomycetota bacterium]|nr:TadE/TadG family type IV pilus assembly protein [Actinomycetota bacterium]
MTGDRTTRSRSRRRRQRDEDGLVAVELALVLPVLVMLLFGILQFGIAFNRQQGVHAAAREGARAGAVVPGSECTRATDAMEGLGVTSLCTVVQNCPGDRVIVEVTADTDIDIPFVGSRTVTLTGRGEYRCEW